MIVSIVHHVDSPTSSFEYVTIGRHSGTIIVGQGEFPGNVVYLQKIMPEGSQHATAAFSLIQFMDVTRIYGKRPNLWSDRCMWSKEAFLLELGTAAENTKTKVPGGWKKAGVWEFHKNQDLNKVFLYFKNGNVLCLLRQKILQENGHKHKKLGSMSPCDGNKGAKAH